MMNVNKTPIDGGSDFFRSLSRTPEYKKMESLIEKSLEDQWNDLVVSGIIKTLYDNYPRYYVNRRGIQTRLKKSFTKAEEEELITSESDLRTLARLNLQEDKISVSSEALNMAALLAFMGLNIERRYRTVSNYNKMGVEVKKYLKTMANKGGQDIINSFKTVKPIKFRLSKKELTNQIKKRTDKLIKGLNQTTKSRMISQIAIGIRKGERKSQMIKRLQSVSKKISKERARKIVMTETVASSEWMRHQTAKMNGAVTKTWVTSGGEKVCPICLPMDGQTIEIKAKFEGISEGQDSFRGLYPPVHPLCQCTVDYTYIPASDFFRSINVGEVLTEIKEFLKRESLVFYEPLKDNSSKVLNLEALWAGGESLVGKDKNITNIYNEVKELKGTKREKKLEEAKEELTSAGFVQLRLMLGLRGKRTPKEIIN